MDCLAFFALLLGVSAAGGPDNAKPHVISRHGPDAAVAVEVSEVKPIVMRSEKEKQTDTDKKDMSIHVDSQGAISDTASKKEGSQESAHAEGELLATSHEKVASRKAHGSEPDPPDDPLGDESQPTFETTTKAPPECEERAGGYKLCKIMMDHECKSPDANMSKQETLNHCADTVFAEGGKFMVFGTGLKKGECFKEHPTVDVQDCYINQDAASCCPQLYERDSYDFYIVVPNNEQDKIKKSEGGGTIPGHGLLNILVGLIAFLFMAA